MNRANLLPTESLVDSVPWILYYMLATTDFISTTWLLYIANNTQEVCKLHFPTRPNVYALTQRVSPPKLGPVLPAQQSV